MALILLGATVIITLVAWFVYPPLQQQGMLFPYQVFHKRNIQQLFTSTFLHADLSHLAFNMITLYFFGPYLESVIGSIPFLILYLSSGIVASLPTVFRHKDNPNYASLGASGAIEAVIFSFILFNPLTKLYIFFVPIGIPAILFGFIYMAYSIYASNRGGGNINHDAHIAGAVYGVVFTLILYPESFSIFLRQLGF